MKEKQKRPVIFYKEIKPDVENLTPRQVLKNCHTREVRAVLGTKDDFVCCDDLYRLDCVAGRVFWKKLSKESITFKNGKIYGNFTDNLKTLLVEAFQLDWLTDHNWAYLLLNTNKTLWQLILQGKITNPEMLAKRFSKLYFKGSYSYRMLKEHFSHGQQLSLWDVYYHTDNPDLFLERYYSALAMETKSASWDTLQGFQDHMSLLRDALHYCKYDNSKISAKWSFKRLLEEHQKQIEQDIIESAEKLSDRQIAPAFEKDNIHLILNERECYIEGCYMHNCVHSCYWRQVHRGRYLLASGTLNGTKFDLGIFVNDNNLSIDQIHSIYNHEVPKQFWTICRDWIVNNSEELLSRVQSIRTTAEVTVEEKDTPF